MSGTKLAVVGAIAVGVIALAGYVVGISNQDMTLRTAIEARQKDNKNNMASMVAKIRQTAEVSSTALDKAKQIIIGNAEARKVDSEKLIMAWITESVPNVDTSTMNNLMNIITAARDSFKASQTLLIDMDREHKTLLRTFPSSMILGFLGRKEVGIVVVTSSEVEKNFKSGLEENLGVFN